MVRLHGINVVYTENARVSMPGVLDFFSLLVYED